MNEIELREAEARIESLDAELKAAMDRDDVDRAEMLLGELEELEYEVDRAYMEKGL